MSGTAMALPQRIVTPRLLLRPPAVDDATAVNEAIRESFPELNAWMEWASEMPELDATREFCREAALRHAEGTDCSLLMLDRSSGAFLGATGYPRFDWQVPSFEIGYWCRTSQCGHGYVTEAVEALTRYAFTTLRARRVEIRMDVRNERSSAVPKRLGFELEGVLRHHVRDHHGRLRDTAIYALLDANNLTRP